MTPKEPTPQRYDPQTEFLASGGRTLQSEPIHYSDEYVSWLESRLIEKEKEVERLTTMNAMYAGVYEKAGVPKDMNVPDYIASLRSELEHEQAMYRAEHDERCRLQSLMDVDLTEANSALRSENEELKKDRDAWKVNWDKKQEIIERLCRNVDVLTASLAEADVAIVNGVVGPDGLCAFCDEQEKNPLVVEVPHKSTCIVLKSQSRQKARGK